MSPTSDTESIRAQQDTIIAVLVSLCTATELRSFAFILLTVGGGIGVPATEGFPLYHALAGGWIAVMGSVVAVEAIHNLPTVRGDSDA